MKLNSHLVTDRMELGERINYLTISNPVYYNNLKLGFSNHGVPETIELYEEKADGTILIPRNAPVVLEDTEIIDERVQGKRVQYESKITLRPDQVPAVEKMMSVGDGILQAGTGKGKSIMALEILSRFGRTTLILVHKEFLMDQFTGHLKNVLGLEEHEIGYCRGNPKSWTWEGRKVVIGMLQSIYAHKDDLPEGFIEYFGLVISDECHRVSASTWSQVITLFPCQKRLGLTATPKRSDGLEVIFHMHLGDIQYQLLGVNMKPSVHIVRTQLLENDMGDIYQGSGQKKINLSKLVSRLSENDERNAKIIQLLIRASQAGRKIILLSDRRGHVELLKQSFDFQKQAIGLADVQTRYYLGGMEQRERREAEENGDILFATYQMAKEGLDIPALDTLFLCTPNSSAITIEQSLGRIARSEEGKKNPMVVDFLDSGIGICNALFNKRMKVYRQMELEVK